MSFIRFSIIVFVKIQGRWLIEHMHVSLPTSAHEEEEAYPIKELEDRNIVLQRLVDEKTKALSHANQELQKRLDEIKTLSGLLPICAACKKIEMTQATGIRSRRISRLTQKRNSLTVSVLNAVKNSTLSCPLK